MKKQILLSLVLSTLIGHFSIAQEFHWVKSFGSFLNDNCHTVTMDNYGNTYVAGPFGSVGAVWNGGSYYNSTPYLFIEGDTLLNNGFNNIFLIKFDQSGSLKWAKSIGGFNDKDSYETVGGLAYDSVNNYLYLSGTATGRLVIGQVTMECSNSDVFLTKFDLNGNCLWGKNFIGSGFDKVNDMCVDNQGNIFMTGQNTESSMYIQNITVEKGSFLAKFNTSGFCVWAKKVFSPGSDSKDVIPKSIACTDHDLVIGVSSTADVVTVDTLQIADSNYNGNGSYNSGLLARFDSSGSVRWAKFLGSPYAAIWTTGIDPEGNVYSSGWYQNTCIFDSLSISGSGGFIVKCNSSGGVLFLNSVGSPGYAHPNDIQIDKAGNCYIVGASYGTVTFGGTTFTTDGAFLVKYSSDGVVTWAKQIQGGLFVDQALGVHVNADGSLIALSGGFTDYIKLGSITIYNSGSNDYNSGDVFVARYDGSWGIEAGITSTIKSLFIFPDPAEGIAFIRIPDEFTFENSITLSMIDLVGNIHLQETIEIKGDKIIQDVGKIPKGFYMVSLNDGRKQYFGKLIIH